MSFFAFMGAIETGLVFGLVALGTFITFRVLKFPDLTVEGSFPLGAAVTATLIVNGVDCYLASLGGAAAGAIAGLITGWMAVRLRILHILASILTAIALYSVNLRIMGRPNTPLLGTTTIFSPLDHVPLPTFLSIPIAMLVIMILVKLALDRFLNSEVGLAMRATGANPRMAEANGVRTDRLTLLGLAIANALTALSGAIFAQIQGAADISMGVGVIVIGLAAVIGGGALMPTRTVMQATLACIIGSILYRIAIAIALNVDFIGLTASDVNVVTAVLVAFALVAPGSAFSPSRLFRRRSG
ncbi:MAG: ABC transporter permease [Candidatus Eiseniibacteriota bacterium]